MDVFFFFRENCMICGELCVFSSTIETVKSFFVKLQKQYEVNNAIQQSEINAEDKGTHHR